MSSKPTPRRLTIKTPATSGPGAATLPAIRRTAQPALLGQLRRIHATSHIERTGPREHDYQGAELRPYEGRPGSLDFLLLPSVIGTRRTYRPDAKKVD